MLTIASESIVINKKEYKINTDFRNWIKFELALQSDKPPKERLAEMLMLCYRELPKSFDHAIHAALDFYCGPCQKAGENDIRASKEPIYSFLHDADAIYAAFFSQYGIDLQTAQLHWWQFLALFKSLNESNQFVKIMHYRAIDLTTIKDKQTKSFYLKMKRNYKLPDYRSAEEKERIMLENIALVF